MEEGGKMLVKMRVNSRNVIIAEALGLFESDTPDRQTSYSMLMQNFTRFILEQLHQESNTPGSNPLICESFRQEPEAPSTIQQLFGLQTMSQSTCSSCHNEVTRITYPFVVDMLYPKKQDQKLRKRSFTSILKGSMYRENQTKAWCSECRQYQPTTTKKVIQGLPGVLMINSGAGSSDEATIWRQNGPNTPKPKKQQEDSEDGESPAQQQPASWVPDRFGIHLNGSDLIIRALPVGREIPPEFMQSPDNCAIYELTVCCSMRVHLIQLSD